MGPRETILAASQLGGALGGQESGRRNNLGFRVSFLPFLNWFSGLPLESLPTIWSKTGVFLFRLFPIEIVWSVSGRVVLKKQVSAIRGCAKTTFRRCREFYNFRVVFLWFWDQFSWLLVPWKQAGNSMVFHGCLGLPPDHPRF